jgi:ribosomal protein L16 Arg81 hydroxylase
MLLEYLLKGGVSSLDTFMTDVWQKRSLHVSHGDPNWLQDLFQLYDVEELWTSALRAPLSSNGGITVFAGKGVKTERAVNPFFAFACRCSVVVNRGDRFCSRLRELCKQLETEQPCFPMACCNVYLTPPDSQSVPKHSDDRDVLLLQVYGSKEWTVYNDPVVLPYRDEELGKGNNTIDESRLTSKSVLQVKQGDVLYMPRGVVHEAKTSSSSSLHITVALQTSDWDYASILTRTVQKTLRAPEFQRSRLCVPLGALSGDAEAGAAASRELQALLQEVLLHRTLQDFSETRQLFCAHIMAMQADREASLSSTSVAVPAPLLSSSLIMWNPSVEVDGIEELSQRDPNVPLMNYIVFCSRPIIASTKGKDTNNTSQGPANDRMKFGVTDETLRCVQWLSKQPSGVPVRVGQLPMFDDLARVSLAIVLINNMSCVRIT